MISIIIPFMQNTPERAEFLKCYIDSIRKQEYKNYEILIVEQTKNENTYKEYYFNSIKHRHIKAFDKHNRGFNLSWMRNIGAKKASGDILVIMDCDFIIPEGYLDAITALQSDFASGSNEFIWAGAENTATYLKTRNIKVFENEGNRFEGYNAMRKMGYGMILIFKKAFYDRFGGFSENFFKYGWEDREAAIRIMKLLKTDETGITRIEKPCYHLWHEGRDLDHSRTVNKSIYEKLITIDYLKLCKEFSKGGNTEKPYIYDYEAEIKNLEKNVEKVKNV